MNRQYGALSGIAIIVIVLNHAITAGSTVSPVSGWWANLLILLQAFGTFAVPTFLFISGAFISYAARGKSALSLKFVWGSLKHILWPYLVWSCIFYIVVIFSRDLTFSAAGYLKNIVVGFPYHFVPLLIFFYIVSPILVIVGKRFGWLLLIAIGLYQAFLIYMTDPAISGSPIELSGVMRLLVPPVLANTMADWAIFFPMGLIFSMHNKPVKSFLQKIKWISLLVTVLLFVVGVLSAFGMMSAPWARYVVPVFFMLLLPVINRKSIPQVKQFEQVGKRSYGVYLSHFIVLDLVLLLISALIPGFYNLPILVYPLLFVVGLVVPLILMEAMAKRPSTRKVYRYVFG